MTPGQGGPSSEERWRRRPLGIRRVAWSDRALRKLVRHGSVTTIVGTQPSLGQTLEVSRTRASNVTNVAYAAISSRGVPTSCYFRTGVAPPIELRPYANVLATDGTSVATKSWSEPGVMVGKVEQWYEDMQDVSVEVFDLDGGIARWDLGGDFRHLPMVNLDALLLVAFTGFEDEIRVAALDLKTPVPFAKLPRHLTAIEGGAEGLLVSFCAEGARVVNDRKC